MTNLNLNGKNIRVDDKGYLVDTGMWNEDVAQALAQREGIDSLSKGQWEIVRQLREYYATYKVFPILDNICRIAHHPDKCVHNQFINPEKSWKIAGLPEQNGVHFVTMDGSHYFMEPYC